MADAHRDIYELNHRLNIGEPTPLRDALLPANRRAGIDLLCFAVGGDSLLHANNVDAPLRGTLENIARVLDQVAKCDGAVRIVRGREELPRGPDGVLYLLFTLEGARPLEGSLEMLEILHALGLRSIQLVWNYRNELGDGAMETGTGGGLSRFGRQVVKRAHELGIVVDLAHATPQTFWLTLEVAEQPVIVCHANASSICPHPRNLADDQIKAVAAQGGFIGIQRSPGRVHPDKPTLNGYVDHIQYMVEMVGADHVGIGLDFNQVTGPRSHKDERFSTSEVRVIQGFEKLENVVDVTTELLRRGFSEGTVAQLMGGNYLRIVASQIGG